jgi:hypothetical protein
MDCRREVGNCIVVLLLTVADLSHLIKGRQRRAFIGLDLEIGMEEWRLTLPASPTQLVLSSPQPISRIETYQQETNSR